MFRAVLDVLFPRRCAGCGSGPWPFCEPCRAGLVPLLPPGCRRCGRPLEVDAAGCRDCPPPSVAGARAAFLYAGPIRPALHRLKFSGWRGVAEALGRAMAEVALFPADAVTWVPLGAARLRDRGFDQAEALASVVAEVLALPRDGFLERFRDTSPQAERAPAERRSAMKGAFRAIRDPPARVLLVDDVLTTGATVGACAAALRAAGVAAVYVLAAARAVGGPLPARCYTRAGLPPESVVARGRPR